MNIFKKNQVVVVVIALMLITAGYLNFIDINEKNDTTIASTNSEDIGDATLVSSNSVVVFEDEKEETTEETLNTISNEENALNISIEENNDDYYTNSRLERDNMYSQIIESYQKMIEADTITAEQKAIAQNEITKINNTKNAIMITENLIKTKGFEDVIILVNDESINVIVPNEKLKHEEIAQIQNIVSREMKAEIENIHISSK